MASVTAPAFYGDVAKSRQDIGFIVAASSCGTRIGNELGGPLLVAGQP
jgi:hypothetical protein